MILGDTKLENFIEKKPMGFFFFGKTGLSILNYILPMLVFINITRALGLCENIVPRKYLRV